MWLNINGIKDLALISVKYKTNSAALVLVLTTIIRMETNLNNNYTVVVFLNRYSQYAS